MVGILKGKGTMYRVNKYQIKLYLFSTFTTIEIDQSANTYSRKHQQNSPVQQHVVKKWITYETRLKTQTKLKKIN